MEKDKLMILMIEDTPLIRMRWRRILEELDNVEAILEAGDYEEAWSILQQENIDVLLLDLGLPGRSGIEVLKGIAAHGWKITIMVLTNQTDNYYKDLCLSLGAHYFFDKSADFDKVPALIQQLKKKTSSILNA